MKTYLTEKERALLTEIVDSEYQDGGNPVDNPVWMDYIVNSKAKGGVLTSLQSKGLVRVNLISRTDSDNFKFSGITDSTIAITETGFAALNQPSPCPPSSRAR